MAYIWFMAIEVASKEAADRLKASFDTSPVTLMGVVITFATSVSRVEDLWWGVMVMPCCDGPEPLSDSGSADSEEHAKLMTETGRVLYERLFRSAPFDVAILGAEPEGFYGFGDHEELVQDLKAGDDRIDGLVISSALWEAAGKPKAFVSPAKGYYWIPWRGEPF